MRAIDTNVLVRLITRDDDRQAESAEEFVANGAWVSHLVLAETVWVLDSVYERTPAEIARAIAMLLAHKQLTVQDQDIVETALATFRKHKGVSISDILIFEIARKNGHLPLGSFDREFAKLEGVQRL
jgi:predicted nucleic-acid-binding protein